MGVEPTTVGLQTAQHHVYLFLPEAHCMLEGACREGNLSTQPLPMQRRGRQQGRQSGMAGRGGVVGRGLSFSLHASTAKSLGKREPNPDSRPCQVVGN